MDGLEDWFVQPENHTEVDQSAARVSTPLLARAVMKACFIMMNILEPELSTEQ